MIRRQAISAYTPSNTDPATLERIFVQRKKLLSKLVKQFESSMWTGDKHHVLLVGPRGSGKTHLVTLVQDRLRKIAKLDDKMRIAWLGEDSTFTGLIDLAVEIAEQLAAEYPAEFNFDFRTPVRSLPSDDAAESILHSIIDRLDGRSILLIMENLDRAFYGLGEMGQKKWRAFLQETARIATLATSQQLFEGISSRDEAFFGFFDIHHLEPLAVDDARELIKKIANEHENRDLIQFLATSEGRYRVRALHHLAGGNHRMYVLLSEFLTKESLDDLVAAFESLADELTPYFQERVRSLSPQQARIIQCLCNASGAMTVKEIADDTFVPERNCSKQLGDLKRKRYVKSEKRGKESYYEMAEPLMRLCLEVKNQRGKPLKLVATFLRAWYPVAKLTLDWASSSDITARNALYRALALGLDNSYEKVVSQQLREEIRDRVECAQFGEALNLAEELVCADLPSGREYKAFVFYSAGEFHKSLSEYTAVIEMDVARPEGKASALIGRGIIYGEQGEVDEERADYTSVIEMNDASADQKARALVNRGASLARRGEGEEGIADFTAAIEMKEATAEPKTKALLNRGITYGQLGAIENELADYASLIAMDDAPVEWKAKALLSRGCFFWRRENFAQSRDDYMNVIVMDGVSLYTRTQALFYLPESIVPIGSQDEAIRALLRAFEEADQETEDYGGTPRDLLKMVLRRGHREWQEYITALVPIYVTYGAGAKLSSGLTKTIADLDVGDYSHAQLDVWNSAWQEAGRDQEVLSIALSSLDAAIRVIKTGNDRPLFDLPLEIREIVRPLLKKSLGAEN